MNGRAVAAQARAEMLLTVRRGESLLVTFVIPLGVLVFFAKVDTITTSFRHPVDFLVPGILALAVLSTAMVSLGIATGYERRYGVLKRLGSTPLSRTGLILAKTINVLVVEIVQVALIVGTGLALGWHTSVLRLLGAVGALLVGTVAFAGLGLALAGRLRAEANLAAANGLFLVLLFLGGMAYPLGDLPRALETFSRGLPAAALSETLRGIVAPGVGFRYVEAAILLAWAIVLPLLAVRVFTWEE